MRSQSLSPIILGLILFFSQLLSGARFEANDKIIISQDVKEDLYVAGGEVTINAKVDGDVIVAGGQVYINDSVMNDVIVAAGTVEIRGFIKDDLRITGGYVTISNGIGGDLIAFAGNVRINEGVTVYGDLVAYCGNLSMNATVRGDARITGGDIYINGSVLGDLDLKGGALEMKGMVAGDASLAASELIIEEPAQFSGNLRYWTEDGAFNLSEFMVGGTAQFDPDLEFDDSINWYYLGLGFIVFWIFLTLSAIIVVLVIVLAFPRWVRRTGEDVEVNWWKHILYGLAYVVGTPIGIGVLFVTVIGIPVAILLSIVYGLSMIYGSAFGAISLASFVGGRLGKGWNKGTVLLLAIAFLVGIRLFSLVPIIGWLAAFVIALFGYGSLISNIRQNPRSTDRKI